MSPASPVRSRELLRSVVVAIRRALEDDTGAFDGWRTFDPAHPARSVPLGEPLGAAAGAAAAYGFANRLMTLRCMEARELIDEVVVRREIYGGRSLAHHRFAQRQPEACLGDDDGLYVVLHRAFAEQAARLPLTFASDEGAPALWPAPAVLARCLRLLSGQGPGTPGESATRSAFREPDALGWAYQYWHAERRREVLARLRLDRSFKIEGPHLAAATQLYTEPYMVRFLVDHTLGAAWSAAFPDRPLEGFDARQLACAPSPRMPAKRVEEITLLDPACGSGHFLLGAFDAFYAMYEQQGDPVGAEAICAAILQHNLFGIDVDRRAIQLAEAALWMKAAERCGAFGRCQANLVYPAPPPDDSRSSNPRDARLVGRTAGRAEREPGSGWARADELGSLLRVPPPAAEPAVGHAIDGRRRSPDLRGLLSRRYDVVLANPPYVDKRNQGRTLRAFLRHHYAEARGNTFAAFIIRALELAEVAVGMVTPQAFLFVRSYRRLRETLGRTCTVAALAQLGPGAFRDAGVDPVLYVLHVEADEDRRSSTPGVYLYLPPARYLAAARAAATSDDLAAADWEGCGRYLRSRRELEVVPGAPLAFRLGPGSLACFAGLPPLRQQADVVLGMKTSDNRRFLRRWWELDGGAADIRARGFAPYEKRASSSRYGGAASHWVRWTEATVAFYRSAYSAQLPNERFWFRPGIAYGLVSRDFSAKALRADHLADMAASCVFPHHPRLQLPLLGLLNGTVARWWLGVLNPTVNFQPIDLQRLPVPVWRSGDRRRLSRLVQRAVETMDQLRALAPDDRLHRGVSGRGVDLEDWSRHRLLHEALLGARHLVAREEADRVASRLYGLPAAELAVMRREVGELSTSYPLVEGFCRGLRGQRSEPRHPRVPAEPVRQQLADITAAGASAPVGRAASASESAPARSSSASAGLRRSEVLCELLSHRLGIHPLSVYRLLQRALEAQRMCWPSEQRRVVADAVTVLAIGLLRPGWPALAGSPPRDGAPGSFAAAGFLIAATPLGAHTLIDAVREALGQRFPGADPALLEQQCRSLLGAPLERWLTHHLFSRHVRQFERRPVLWQLASRPRRKGAAALSCFVHGPGIDADTLPKIRSQWLAPLRRALVEEREGLGAAAARSLTARRRRLEEWLVEVDDFSRRLSQVEAEGFACETLHEVAASEPLDGYCAPHAQAEPPRRRERWIAQQGRFAPATGDGIRVNIAPLERAGVLAAAVLPRGDAERAIADRARWRRAERQWCRDGSQRQPSWWSQRPS